MKNTLESIIEDSKGKFDNSAVRGARELLKRLKQQIFAEDTYDKKNKLQENSLFKVIDFLAKQGDKRCASR